MNLNFNTKNAYALLGATILLLSLGITGCGKFVELDAPSTSIGVQEAFTTESAATSAVLGLYNSSAMQYISLYYTGVTGSSADDVHYSSSSVDYDQFANNAITVDNGMNNNNIWTYGYSQLFQINQVIEGLKGSPVLGTDFKNQLMGEALTWRAFMYFYLVNFYGDVPLVLSTDIDKTAHMARTPKAQVWKQIETDLSTAASLLNAAYPSADRARINQFTAKALLTRVYLFEKKWSEAEQTATAVLQSSDYELNPDLNTVFTKDSKEIIWQIANTTGISTYGSNFLAPDGVLPAYILYNTMVEAFEPGDQRRIDWVLEATVSGKNYDYVYKYKDRAGTGDEYNVMLRLAEVYLIRAEARAEQNKMSGSLEDLNVIRHRAGLEALAGLDQGSLLLAIQQEYKVEMFGEWSHRWLDLKRWPSLEGKTSRADDLLAPIKADWQSTDVLYPIPQQQILANTALTQNPGYGK